MLVGESGGGAFVLVYLICIFLVGIPLIIAEISIGRAGGKDASEAISPELQVGRRGYTCCYHKFYRTILLRCSGRLGSAVYLCFRYRTAEEQ